MQYRVSAVFQQPAPTSPGGAIEFQIAMDIERPNVKAAVEHLQTMLWFPGEYRITCKRDGRTLVDGLYTHHG